YFRKTSHIYVNIRKAAAGYQTYYLNLSEKQITIYNEMRTILILLLLIPCIAFTQDKEELLARIESNPHDINTISLIQKVGGYDPDYKELVRLCRSLDRKVRLSTKSKIFDTYLTVLKHTPPGKLVPSITPINQYGGPHSFSDSMGNVVLFD